MTLVLPGAPCPCAALHVALAHCPRQPLQHSRDSHLTQTLILHPRAATGAHAGVVVGKRHSLTWLLPGEEGPLGTAPLLHCRQWEPCGAPSIIPPPGTNLPSSGRTAAHPPAPHPCLPAPSGGSASSALSPAPASGGAERPKDKCTGSCTQLRRDEDGVGAGLTCPRGDEHPQHIQPGGGHATCSR